MCGVFGFVSKNGAKPNMSILRRVAATTMLRGPHAWGMAWVDADGTLRSYKQSGRIVDAMPLLAMAKDAVMIAGHCRYATHGDPAINTNNHPHDAGDAWIVHNGMIHHYRELVKKHRLRMHTECDSEVLGLMIAKFGGSPFNRAVKAVREARGPNPFSMMALWPDRMVLARMNHQPLHCGETSAAHYFASLRQGLPGKVVEMPNEEIVEYR